MREVTHVSPVNLNIGEHLPEHGVIFMEIYLDTPNLALSFSPRIAVHATSPPLVRQTWPLYEKYVENLRNFSRRCGKHQPRGAKKS